MTLAATTQTDIVNAALGHLHKRAIASMTENSPERLEASRAWPKCLKECLRAFPWPFAKVTEALALSDIEPPSQYEYAYAWPANAATVWIVYNEATANQKEGEVFEKLFDPDSNAVYIATNCDDAIAVYTYLLEDTSKYDSFFCSVLSLRLAVEMCGRLVGDDDLSTNLMKTFQNMISDAKRLGSYEDKSTGKDARTSSFEDARE